MQKRKIEQQRMLTSLEVQILKFLWKWKLSDRMVLKYTITRDKRLKIFKREKIIHEVLHAQSKKMFCALKKNGFNDLKSCASEISQKPFKSQSVNFQRRNFVLFASDPVQKFVVSSPILRRIHASNTRAGLTCQLPGLHGHNTVTKRQQIRTSPNLYKIRKIPFKSGGLEENSDPQKIRTPKGSGIYFQIRHTNSNEETDL